MKTVRSPLSLILISLGAAAALTSVPALADATLHIPAGQSRQLDAAQAIANFTTWTLEDGATLILPAGVERWQWQVDRADIGSGVRILSSGAAGTKGADGSAAGGRADPCRDGKPGGNGEPGGNGRNGASLDLRLGLASIGSLSIEVPGGPGGNGGNGGNGQDGGATKKCPGGDGGSGGNGGDGGDGGNGGNVQVHYSYLAEPAPTAAPAIRITAAPGAGGLSGTGGGGGAGSSGGYVSMRTLSGDQKWMPGGAEGRAGDTGKPGRSGVAGQILLEQDINRRLERLLESGSIPHRQTTATEPDERTRQLERKLEEALRRIDALESKPQ